MAIELYNDHPCFGSFVSHACRWVTNAEEIAATLTGADEIENNLNMKLQEINENCCPNSQSEQPLAGTQALVGTQALLRTEQPNVVVDKLKTSGD